tara:strand:- start:639 stop:1838 length:1200 start_codon:yes stop_codon:yes gene_type:complete
MIKYFIKYYIYNGNSKNLKSSFVLPISTIIVGSFVMMMSFSIMEGFFNKISDTIYFFDKEHSITINKKEFFNDYEKKDLDSLINFLIKKDYFFNLYEDRMMFLDNGVNKAVARVYGVVDFHNFKPNQFFLNELAFSLHDRQEENMFGCYLGYNQFVNIGVDVGGMVKVSSILDFQNLNSFPEKRFHIKGILKTDIFRYDNSIFIPFDSLLFGKNIFLNINLNKEISESDLRFINSNFVKGTTYNKNIHLFSELFYAINYEKFFYAFFGLFIILISSIMLMGFNVSSVIQNISSIGLLESLGLNRSYIGLIYLLNSLFMAITGFLVSYLLFNVLLHLDNTYQIMDYLFDPNIYFAFDLQLSNNIVIKIFLLVLILVSLSTIYPLYKISKLDIIESIKSRN